MSIRLVTHSRLHLREAWAAGLLDEEQYQEAARLMDELGVPDGAQIAFEGDTWAEDLQSWLDRMPLRYSTATRKKFGGHAAQFLDSLAASGKTLSEVDEDHIRSWAQTRQKGRAAGTWAKEEQALMMFLGWMSDPSNPRRVFEASPWPVWKTGARTTSAVSKKASTLTPRVRMLDDEEWRWFRNVGLAGRGLPEGALAPRYPDRDTVLGDLLVSTGARIGEARCLLIDEVPQPAAAQRALPWPNTMLFLGGARAKTRGGRVPFLPEVGDRLWEWWESPVRQAIVESAQESLRRRLRAGTLFVVEEVSLTKSIHTFKGSWLGADVQWSADALPTEAAEAAVRVEGSRITPLTLWQTDANGGGPMSGTALRNLFAEATVRVASHPAHPLGDDLVRWERRNGVKVATGGITPHMMRHTAAVNWLVELTLEVRRRGTAAGVRHVNPPSSGAFDPMLYVQQWLRHTEGATTQQYQTWVNRHDWPEGRSLGSGIAALVKDWNPSVEEEA